MKFMRSLNPYFYSVLAFLSVLAIYEIHWSTIYPKLSLTLLLFFTLFLLVSFILGRLFLPFFKKEVLLAKKSKFTLPRWIVVVLLLLIILGTVADRVYSNGFPLLGQVQYDNFGVPTLHAVIMVFATFTSIYSVQLICQKKQWQFMLIVLLISLVPSFLSLSRGSLVMDMAMFVGIFLYSVDIKIMKKPISILIILVGVIILYGFGLVGNYRLNNQVKTETTNIFDSSLIYQIGSASSVVPSQSLAAPFFWSYLYLTSPTANLQSSINSEVRLSSSDRDGIKKLLITQYVPDVISSHVYPNYKNIVASYGYSTRVNGNLNVATTFYESFVQMGWMGMILMVLVYLCFPVIYLYLISKIQPKFFIMSLSVLNVMYVLAVFDNPWKFSALSLQLILIMLLGVFSKIKLKS